MLVLIQPGLRQLKMIALAVGVVLVLSNTCDAQIDFGDFVNSFWKDPSRCCTASALKEVERVFW
jgi:hypothetical protein